MVDETVLGSNLGSGVLSGPAADLVRLQQHAVYPRPGQKIAAEDPRCRPHHQHLGPGVPLQGWKFWKLHCLTPDRFHRKNHLCKQLAQGEVIL